MEYIAIVIGIALVVFIGGGAFFAWAMCAIASEADDAAERRDGIARSG